eukprot:SAG11_NODE_8798_length_975_cov_0.961187_3_plen_88_part_01
MTIEVDGIDNDKEVDYELKLSRAKFESLNLELFNRSMESVVRVLKDGGLTKEAVDEVVLIGGSTRIPKVEAIITRHFKKAPCKAINAD